MPTIYLISMLLLALSGLACSTDRQDQMTGENRTEPVADNRSPTGAMGEVQIAEGQLLRTDAKEDFIWVKTTDGREMKFSYTMMTEVEGEDKDKVESLV